MDIRRTAMTVNCILSIHSTGSNQSEPPCEGKAQSGRTTTDDEGPVVGHVGHYPDTGPEIDGLPLPCLPCLSS